MKIAIIGHGNVATHLMNAFATTPHEAVQVNSRTLVGLPADAALYLICVKDDAIAAVAEKLSEKLTERLPAETLSDELSPERSAAEEASPSGYSGGVVAHTSGSVGIEALAAHRHRGVWYPMQTFTKGDTIDYTEIPVFIEASDAESLSLLRRAAESFAGTVVEADAGQRKALHLAAVFACNFTNRLFGIADEVLRSAGLNFELMLPLIRQSVSKVSRMSPAEAQTGPASRGDAKVCRAQMQMLASSPELQNIYKLLSRSIADAAESNKSKSDEQH